jgi:hypothetical protein
MFCSIINSSSRVPSRKASINSSSSRVPSRKASINSSSSRVPVSGVKKKRPPFGRTLFALRAAQCYRPAARVAPPALRSGLTVSLRSVCQAAQAPRRRTSVTALAMRTGALRLTSFPSLRSAAGGTDFICGGETVCRLPFFFIRPLSAPHSPRDPRTRGAGAGEAVIMFVPPGALPRAAHARHVRKLTRLARAKFFTRNQTT